jgi:hypothetical protein
MALAVMPFLAPSRAAVLAMAMTPALAESAHDAGDGRNIDDASPVLLRHVIPDFPYPVVAAVHIDAHHSVVVLDFHFLDASERRQQSGVVNQDIGRAKPGPDFIGRFLDALGTALVYFDGDSLDSEVSRNTLRDFLGAFDDDIRAGYVHAFRGQGPGDSVAHRSFSTRSGYNSNFPFDT